jgi:cysteine desulfurase
MWLFGKQNKRIYLDYAAATPMRAEVVKAMTRYQAVDFGNPGAIHLEGQLAKQAVLEAREKVARALRVRPTDIIFTSGGTESNNLALAGSASAMLSAGVVPSDIEIISLKTEHPSITNTLEALAGKGIKVLYAPIGEDGLVNIEGLKKLLSSRTRLVTIALANSETGVVQDLARIGRAIRAFEKDNGLSVIFHTDASQAPLWLPCALDALLVDMMTLDAGKCRGPKGIGVLVRRGQVKINHITEGGSQEGGLRPGTEPVALVVGAVEAIVLAQAEAKDLAERVAKFRDRWVRELMEIPGLVFNGSMTDRLPNNLNISLPGFDTEFAVIFLDHQGVAASTKSACSGAGSGRSAVIYAMTGDEERAASTIRFSLAPDTTWSDLQKTTTALKQYMAQMQPLTFDHK